jgi:hypothetical protein
MILPELVKIRPIARIRPSAACSPDLEGPNIDECVSINWPGRNPRATPRTIEPRLIAAIRISSSFELYAFTLIHHDSREWGGRVALDCP